MSIPKIVGTETELRLDCVGLSAQSIADERRISSSYGRRVRFVDREFFEDFLLPDMVIQCVIAKYGAKNNQNGKIVPELKKVTDILSKKYSSVKKNVREHEITRVKGFFFDRSTEAHASNLQRLGYSGGYLPSGFRFYLDYPHAEFCTPECSSPEDLVACEKAGEIMIEAGRVLAEEKRGVKINLYKDNSDGYGKSWGAHENYLVGNKLFNSLTDCEYSPNPYQLVWMSFLISRFIYCGSGKFGGEIEGGRKNQFLISQRAEFLSELISNSTTYKRGLINTRDVPYVGDQYGRRLHVIAGDANMSETAIYLKIGAAMIMLMMLEDDYFSKRGFPVFRDPLKAMHRIIRDVSLKTKNPVLGVRAKELSALEMQMYFAECAEDWYANRYSQEHDTAQSWIPCFLKKLEEILDVLTDDPLKMDGVLDWPTKYNLCLCELDNRDMGFEDLSSHRNDKTSKYLSGISMAYHRLDDAGIYNRLKQDGNFKRMVSDAIIERAVSTAPIDTRAGERARLIKEFREEIIAINWHSVLLKGFKVIALKSPYAGDYPADNIKEPLEAENVV